MTKLNTLNPVAIVATLDPADPDLAEMLAEVFCRHCDRSVGLVCDNHADDED